MITKEEKSQILAEAALLRELVYSEGGRAYFARLTALIEIQRNSITEGSKENFELAKGQLEGLRIAANIPLRAEELAERLKHA